MVTNHHLKKKRSKNNGLPVFMSGFPELHLEKYVKRLNDAGWTVAVHCQEPTCPKIRKEMGVFSPGTNSESIEGGSNRTMVVWIEVYDKTKLNIKCIPVKHGLINCMAFIINKKCAYASDINQIYKDDLKNFVNLKYLVIDCLRLYKHPAHFNLEDVLKLINFLKPKKTILTNLHSDLDYNYLLKVLPNNVIPAFDGLAFNI